MAMAGVGFGRGFMSANVYGREITLDSLPPELDGLKVLHLSDLHLRHYVTLEHLEDVLRRAEPMKPDLILVTGDIADDLRQLPDALSMISQLNPPLGTFASLGNHEYFRGLDEVRSIFHKSTVPLFVDRGTRITHRGKGIFVGGIDDPRFMRSRETGPEFYSTALDKTLLDAASDDTTLIMSHRPNAFDSARERSVDLVLAGHTHGGQIGFMGRSVLETAFPENYLWGHYHRGNSHLYTSSGMGHWLPFRLGCPPEAPVINLRSGQNTSA
jgi:predicted MPP superfamily phosphohydrolase